LGDPEVDEARKHLAGLTDAAHDRVSAGGPVGVVEGRVRGHS